MSEWIKEKLGNYIGILQGYPFKSEDFINKGVPIIKIKNIVPPYVITDKSDCVDSEIIIGKEKYILSYGDIIISLTGSKIDQINSAVGKIGRVRYNEISLLNQRLGKFYIIKKEQIDYDFLYYFLTSGNRQMWLANNARGSANQANISTELILSMDIIIPTYPNQKNIAGILVSFDKKIETCNKIIANLNAQIEAIFKNWFIVFAPFADNLSEEGIPTGWRNSNVFDESEEVSERNKDDLEYPVLSVVKDGEFVLSEDRFTKQVYSKEQTKYKIVSRNQIGFNPARANIGSIAMLTDFDKGLVSPIYIVFKLKDSILPTYFYYYMKRPVFLQNIQAQAIGTTRQNLSYDAFKLFPMIVPPTDIQQKFIELIAPMEQEIANQKKQIEKLANTRDTLLPKLMSGEIEVPVEE